MEVQPCKCGEMPYFWRLGDIYVCGCINPNCDVANRAKSLKSKEDAIKRWNENMTRGSNNEANR